MSSFSLDTKTSVSHIGSDVVLCAALPYQLSCHVYMYRYSNISESVCDHWKVNCNDLVQDCGLFHSASISPVHTSLCKLHVFFMSFPHVWLFTFFYVCPFLE